MKAAANASAGPSARPWPELDLLRGFAVIAMLLNHTAAWWWTRDAAMPALVRASFVVGGLAPVGFFLATGLGSGIQCALGRSASGTARKALILFVADFFLRWMRGPGSGLGLDFLAFIGLSMLVLAPLRSARNPLRSALIAAGAVIAVRFAIGPLIPEHLEWALQATGRMNIRGISYPLFPWLAIPLLGFAAGYAAQSRRARFDQLVSYWGPRIAWVSLAGGLLALAAWMQSLGMPRQRYGMMSATYLPFALGGSFAALALAHACTRAAVGSPWAARAVDALGARGLASLAVVPIHIAILECARASVPPLAATAHYAIACFVLVVVSMGAARAVDRGVGRIAAAPGAGRAWLLLAAFAALSVPWLAFAELSPLGRPLLAGAGQLATCVLVGLPLPGRTTRPARRGAPQQSRDEPRRA